MNWPEIIKFYGVPTVILLLLIHYLLRPLVNNLIETNKTNTIVFLQAIKERDAINLQQTIAITNFDKVLTSFIKRQEREVTLKKKDEK